MVGVHSRCFSFGSCPTRPKFNVESRKKPEHCKQHADDSMIDVRNKLCSHDSFARLPTSNAQGRETGLCCKQHGEDGAVGIYNRRCSNGSWTKTPSFNVEARNPTVRYTSFRPYLRMPMFVGLSGKALVAAALHCTAFLCSLFPVLLMVFATEDAM